MNCFNEIISRAADQTFKKKKSNNQTKRKCKHKKWFDKDCIHLKKDLLYSARLVNKYPFDVRLRELYFVKKKKYKKIIKIKQENERNLVVNKLTNLKNTNPKQFWNLINELKNSNTSTSTCIPISPEKWDEYYKTLNMTDKNNDFHNSIGSKILNMQNRKESNHMMNSQITEKEIILAIKKLKNKKSPGYDGYCSELLKCSSDFLIKPLQKLFNLILESGIYPEMWNISIITHIFKKGTRDDPDNYRGISVSSCVGKTFCSIINNRISQYIETNNILNNNQAGFRKGYRTTDQIFVLKTIVKKYLSLNRKLYACFVDFKKAFDSVWRNGLFFKLLDYGINGRIYDIIRNMYENTKSCIRFKNKISNIFETKKGVRQGCIISPILFNLFINDITKSLEDVSQDQITINNNKINSLLYADDLVIMSKTNNGLQNYLNNYKTTVKNGKFKLIYPRPKL